MVVGGRELIDTLWNVNEVGYNSLKWDLQELIDTLWNVNNISEETLVGTITELIDTLWNVNKISIVLPFGIPPN